MDEQPVNLNEFRQLMLELGSKADSLTVIAMTKVIDLLVDAIEELQQDNKRLLAVEEDLTYLLEKDSNEKV